MQSLSLTASQLRCSGSKCGARDGDGNRLGKETYRVWQDDGNSLVTAGIRRGLEPQYCFISAEKLVRHFCETLILSPKENRL